MKKIILFCLLALTGLTFVSCRYNEGPFISFTKPEDRLVGYWKLKDVYCNGAKMDSTTVFANQKGNYYAFFFEGMMSVSALDSTMNLWEESDYGGWQFENRCKEIYVIFSLKHRKYEYTATIKRLSRTLAQSQSPACSFSSSYTSSGSSKIPFTVAFSR